MPDTNFNALALFNEAAPQAEARRQQARSPVERRTSWAATPRTAQQQRRRGETYAQVRRPLEWSEEQKTLNW